MSRLLAAQVEATTVREFGTDALTALILGDLGLDPQTSRVEFMVETRTMGYGMAEHDVKMFTGVRVTPSAPSTAERGVTNGDR